jgi:hypothetical protein
MPHAPSAKLFVDVALIRCVQDLTCSMKAVICASLLLVSQISQSASDPAATPIHPDTFRHARDPDDTRSINQALMTGKPVQLEAGKEYNICSPLVVHSHQEFFGGAGTWIIACSDWNAVNGSSPPNKKLIRNEHWEAASITDAGLSIHDIGIDGSNLPNPVNGITHAIGIRKTRDIVVYNITCKNIGDCTAFQADEDYVVRDSLATGVTNAGFDNWEGPKNGTVEHTRTYCAKGGTGVMFTGASTELRPTSGSNVISDGNEVYGPCTAAIMFNNLSAGSSLRNIQSISDSYGIVVQGNVVTGTILNPFVSNTSTGQALSIRPERYPTGIATPSNIEIANAVLSNDSTSSSNIAPITLFGTDNKIVNTRLSGGRYDYAIQTNDRSLKADGSIDPGSYGTIKFQPNPK